MPIQGFLVCEAFSVRTPVRRDPTYCSLAVDEKVLAQPKKHGCLKIALCLNLCLRVVLPTPPDAASARDDSPRAAPHVLEKTLLIGLF